MKPSALPAAGTVGNPAAQHRDLRRLRRGHPGHRHPGLARHNRTAADYYAGGRRLHRPAERHRDRGRLPVGRLLPRHRRRHRPHGYDGFLYSIGFLVAWLVALLLVAELLRNTGKFTMADVLAFRLRQGPVRTAAAISTLAVSLFYLLAQMAGAGGLVSLLLGIDGTTGQNITIVVVGVLMIIYVLVGGMKGTTWVQIIKAVLLIAGAAVMTLLVLGKFGFNLSARCSVTPPPTGTGRDAVLEPGPEVRQRPTSKIDFISLSHRPGARHRGPAARADALLHGARPPRRPASRSSGRSG